MIDHPNRLHVLIADECHVGYGETDKSRKGANDYFVNYWAREGKQDRHPANLLILQVSATPFNVLSSCSRVPERRRLLQPYTVSNTTYPARHIVTIIRKSPEDIDIHFSNEHVELSCQATWDESSEECYLQGSGKIYVDWKRSESVVEWQPPRRYQSLDNYCEYTNGISGGGLKVETDDCFEDYLSFSMQSGEDNDEADEEGAGNNQAEDWNAVDVRIACLKVEYVLSLMYAVRFRWNAHPLPASDDHEYRTGDYIEKERLAAEEERIFREKLEHLLDDILSDDVTQFRNATVQRKNFLLALLRRLYSYKNAESNIESRTKKVKEWSEKAWNEWNLKDEFRNLLRPLLEEVAKGKNEESMPYWGVTDEIIKNLLKSGGRSDNGHMNGKKVFFCIFFVYMLVFLSMALMNLYPLLLWVVLHFSHSTALF